jgi:hypothetical protein
MGYRIGRRELGGLLTLGALALTSGAKAADGQAAPTGGVHDFDYHVGSWTSVQRRMKQSWTTSPEWDEFPGKTTYVQYLDGTISIDQTDFQTKGFSGLTMRVFDPVRRQWFIYWINSRNPAPMIGGFQGNRGLFYGDDKDGDLPIKVRFIRTKMPPDKERWEQAFSRDNGQSWETNWTADFTRVRA